MKRCNEWRKVFLSIAVPPPAPPAQLVALQCWGDNSKTSSRQPQPAPVISGCVMQIVHDGLAAVAGTDLDTAGQRRRRGHTVRSRSLRRCRRSLRDRDQCSQSAWEFQAASPTCPLAPCRPSQWPAPRGPGPGGRGSSWRTGPSPSVEQSALGQDGCYLIFTKVLWFSDCQIVTSEWKEEYLG